MNFSKNLIAALICMLFTLPVFSHPTGNMIVVGDSVLWPYVCPADDPGHHACVMIWSEGNSPEPYLKSEYSASDFILYNRGDVIFIAERRYNQASQKNELRILKSSMEGSPQEIWPWFEHDLRIGDGGFFMPAEDEIVFVSYPDIYRMKRSGDTIPFFELDEPIKRLRSLENNRLLFLGDGKAWLTNHQGEIIKYWKNLTLDSVDDPPLNRNQIFDIDFQDDKLLLANWGNRSFDIIENENQRRIIVDLDTPLAPHWVAHFGNLKLLFASLLVMDGTNPKPHLLMENEENEIITIWTSKPAEN